MKKKLKQINQKVANNKVSIPLYDGMELKMTVENGFLVAEYSEENFENEQITDLPIDSIIQVGCKKVKVIKGDSCSDCFFGGKCRVGYCSPKERQDKESIIYQEVKEEPKQEFKNGDFIIRTILTDNWIVIFKSYRDTKSIQYHAALFSNISLRFNDWCDSKEDFRLATEEEKQPFLDAIHKGGRDWNGEKVVDYVEPLKEGDMCIFWNAIKNKAILGVLVQKSVSGLYVDRRNISWENAIKCESLEQYQQFIKSE